MIEDNSILIRNVYYMLSYAFQELKRDNYDYVKKEQFEHIYDLFSEILFRGISYQIKQGLYKKYIERQDSLPILRGKLSFNETIKNRKAKKRELAFEYDELSENNIFNQIVKTTAYMLVRHSEGKIECKNRLKGLLPFFDNVDFIDLKTIRWENLQYQRNNQSYQMLMNVCYFVIDGMLMTTESGTYKMATFLDRHMNRLFEKFVLEYYRIHYKKYGLGVSSEKIDWIVSWPENQSDKLLPKMKTDITLRKGKHTLIIDTKYYGKIVQSHKDKAMIHSGNLYQIFSYVKNMDKDDKGDVSGMLLYAKTQEDISPDFWADFTGNKIWVKTLDLNQEFSIIEQQLHSILQVAGLL